MGSKAGALWRALASLVLLAGVSAPARADLVPLTNATADLLGAWHAVHSVQVAFDDVNQVYLVVWGTSRNNRHSGFS